MFKKKRNYAQDWIDNKRYVAEVYKGQEGAQITEPTVGELRNALKQYNPQSVLEVGCGWGRLMKPIKSEFNLAGCDIQKDYLEMAKKEGLNVFEWDVVKGVPAIKKYDVLFCYGVLMYFNEEQIQKAIENMLQITNKKIIIFEWADVCEKILNVVNKKSILNSNKLELHLILNFGLEEWKKSKKRGKKVSGLKDFWNTLENRAKLKKKMDK